jgi:PAS domain S-box-containing protein
MVPGDTGRSLLEDKKSPEIFNLVSNMIVILDKNGNISFLNRKGCEILGYKYGELSGKNWFDTCIPKENREEIKNVFRKCMEGKIRMVEYYENPVLTKKGERRLVSWHNTTMKNNSGKTIGMLSYGEDITERRKAEDSLKEKEGQLRSIFNSADDIILTVDITGKITSINEKVYDIFGYRPEEVIGKNFARIGVLHLKEIPKIARLFADVMMKGKVIGGRNSSLMEISFKDKNGKTVPAEVSTTLIKKDGKVTGALNIIRDVTERKRSEENLRSSEERFRMIFEHAPDAYYLTDMRGMFIDGNIEAERIIGCRRGELIGKSFTKLNMLKKGQLPKAISLLVKNAAGMSTGPEEFTIIRKDGKEVPIEISTHPVKIGGRKLVLGIARDITERKKTEEDMKKMDRLKNEFMNIGAHELKTPLIPIVGYLDMMKDSRNLKPDQKDQIDICLRNARRLQMMINEILDTSKLEAGSMKFDMKPINPAALIKNSVKDMMKDAAAKGLKLTEDVPEKLPNIMGDEYRLTQVMANLVNNAIKYTDKGGINVRAAQKGGNIQVSVEDTGIGIAKKDMPKIFTKFFQADTSEKRKHGGTGLGLAICEGIIKQHGGNIWMESKLGKGSKFIFTLPIKK